MLEEDEDQANDLLHLLVGIERDFAGRLEDITAGEPQNQLAALRLGPAALSMRALRMWISASLIVPLSPSSRRSL